MTTFQNYLNTLQNKENIKEINLSKIQSEREKSGDTELLQGGELDLREFKNLEKLEIDPQFLTTPLVKLNVDGLIHLKEVDWLETKPESEEDKKLWTELGISEDISKKRVVKEVQRLVELFSTEKEQKIAVNFATEKAPQEKLGDKNGLTEKEEDSFAIYLNLEQENNLIFWTLAQELAHILTQENDKELGIKFSPSYWNNLFFEEQSVQKWITKNINFDILSDSEWLKITDYSVYLGNPDFKQFHQELLEKEPEGDNLLEKKTSISISIANETWQKVSKEIVNLTSQELNKGISKEEAVKLWFKLTVSEEVIKINYHSENPFKNELEKLIANTPLKLEIQALKEEKEQLPTSENFAKLTKQVKLLESYLENLMSEEEYEKLKEEINKIN